MYIESQEERVPRLDLQIQKDLILDFGGRTKAEEWINKYGEQFRKIIEKNPELIENYPRTKEIMKKRLYGETIH